MRQLTARTAARLARLACADSAAAARAMRVVGSSQQGPACGGSEPSSSGRDRAWQPQAWRGFASAAEPVAAAATPEKAGLVISDSAVERLKELGAGVVLRIMVEGGGCSGFQYEFSLDEAPKEDDRVFEREGVRVVCDDLSLEFLRGATIDYESDLMRSAFVVNSNPNAASSCGCGSSFVAK